MLLLVLVGEVPSFGVRSFQFRVVLRRCLYNIVGFYSHIFISHGVLFYMVVVGWPHSFHLLCSRPGSTYEDEERWSKKLVSSSLGKANKI